MDTNYFNRPGRMYYHMVFDKLEKAFVDEYLEDTLKKREYIDSLKTFIGVVGDLNFDMLQAIVEEINNTEEEISIKDIISDLNIDVESERSNWKIVDIKANFDYSGIDEGDVKFLDPLRNKFSLWFYMSKAEREEDEPSKAISFDIHNIKNKNGDEILYEKDGVFVKIRKERNKPPLEFLI